MSSRRKKAKPVKRQTYGVIDLTNKGNTKDSSTSKEREDTPLNSLLDQAAFYIHLTNRESVTGDLLTNSCQYKYLGNFFISIPESESTPPKVTEMWLYMSDNVQGQHFLYQEQNAASKNQYLVTFSKRSTAHLISRLAVGMSPYSMLCLLYHTSSDSRTIDIQVYIDQKYVIDMTRHTSYHTKVLPRVLYSIPAALHLTGSGVVAECEEKTVTEPIIPPIPSSRHDLASLYRAVKDKPCLSSTLHQELKRVLDVGSSDAIQSESSKHRLLSKLRPYQLKAVKWMISMERGWYSDAYKQSMQELFHPLSGTDLYINRDSGLLAHQPPRLHLMPGGILADEMGLGKTVEVLTCMVGNPRQDLDVAPGENSPLLPGDYCVLDSDDADCISLIGCDDALLNELRRLKELRRVGEESNGYQHIDATRKGVNGYAPQRLECPCGTRTNSKVKVECSMCSLQQHASCVGYDIRDPYRGAYKCPHCHVISEPIRSGATLIIAPSSIRHQWREEIIKHVGSSQLKVLEYEGVSSKKDYVQPMTLARQDIVITTYDVLRAELKSTQVPHSNSEVGRKFRKPKRFMALPSPLTAVQWWRVCLDEAQMVESVTTATSEMALKLSAVNRWCVTGTPINTSVADLYGLIVFLSAAPFSSLPVWNGFLYRPYCSGSPENLHALLRHVMWRTGKEAVKHQLRLAEQKEVLHHVTFTPVEDLFYRKIYSECRAHLLQALDRYPDKKVRLDSLSANEMSALLHKFMGLRKACCYPQLAHYSATHLKSAAWQWVADGSKAKRVGHKSNLTMDQLLQQMTKKVKVECEESQRCIVAALNGQAACHLMKQEYNEAILKYLEVLKPSTVYDDIRTDPLQLMHAAHNLRETLLTHNLPAHSHIDTDQLYTDEVNLSDKYLEKSVSAVSTEMSNYNSLSNDVFNNRLIQVEDAVVSYWNNLLHISDIGCEELLRAANTLVSQFSHSVRFYSLGSASGLAYYLTTQWTKMVSCHTSAREAMDGLVDAGVDKHIVDEVVNCCLRPDTKTKVPENKCQYCKVEQVLKNDEYHLFDFTNRYFDEDGEEQRKGTWASSVTECLFKAVISHYRQSHSSIDSDTLADNLEFGAEHLKLLDSMKKHFKSMRVLWRRLRDRVAASDELSMSTLRFRLREAWETNTNIPSHVVEWSEVEQLHVKQISDQQGGEAELKHNLRQLNYLKHIGSQEVDPVTGNKELCPICQLSLGHNWAVLSCCHSFCSDCIHTLTNQQLAHLQLVSGRRIRCAICREATQLTDISYVSSGKVMCRDFDVEVKGDYSSKVMEVIRCLKTIERDDPEAKVLVFSTWTSLLEIIRSALVMNDISHRQLLGSRAGNNYERQINSFRRTAGIEVLLLPISSGANGLNLTEATHVILLEPLLNPGQEAQAIGRVHRIGQTKETYVHKFIVKHTIEERVHSIMSRLSLLVQSSTSSLDEMPLTLADLENMFSSETSLSHQEMND